ncbi:hypothetical protein SLEP1_g45387 [Rubroshorea leprosula]|uniref:Uncharacterized protein n=1 Tax=Rubroshorea leprosula TaxID=152421 RepID=A0AAV5LLG2_9ROSI|nr:hypothetical protein SLEP1_g45387 [Rubroshorea leprosula]
MYLDLSQIDVFYPGYLKDSKSVYFKFILKPMDFNFKPCIFSTPQQR